MGDNITFKYFEKKKEKKNFFDNLLCDKEKTQNNS